MTVASASAPSAAAALEPKVLSIQSHVVHGCVGNRAAIPALQWLGVETDVLNTVQYSNHVGYGSFAGEKLGGEALWELLQGMHKNGLLAPSHVLTGYMGSVEAVRAVVRALPQLRASSPACQYWCDSVLGDHGRVYVPPVLVDVYRDEVVPHAHALLPNQFEAELLSGVTIRTEADARRACGVLHRRGVNLVVITSASLEDTAATQGEGELPPLTVLLSQRPHGAAWRREYRVDVPQLPERFAGTGDLLAALLLGWTSKPSAPRVALGRAVAGIQAVVRRTAAHAAARAAANGAATNGAASFYGDEAAAPPLGLRLLDSIDEIRSPDEATLGAVRRLDVPLRGVLFDMDGTLTLPHLLDFAAMRQAVGLPPGSPIRDGIEALPDEKREAAWAEVERIELANPSELQPGLLQLMATLKRRGLLVGIATRNTARGVDAMLAAAGLPPDSFAPVLTREGPFPDKPHPEIALTAAREWGVPPEACLMVGDSMDDVRCGRAAGMATCLLAPEGSAAASPPFPAEVDFAISELPQLEALLEDATEES